MVVAELTMTVVLLVGAGLLGKSFYRLLHVDLGFVPERMALLQVAATSKAYRSPQQQINFLRQIDARLAPIPGVRSSAFATKLPIGDGDGSENFRIVGRAWPSEHNEVLVRDVSAGYFSTLQTRLLRGRYFADSEDTSHARVVLINREMAKTYFPGEDLIGKQIYIEGSPNKRWKSSASSKTSRRGSPIQLRNRQCIARCVKTRDDEFAIALRTDQDEDSVLSAAAKAIHSLDPGLAVYDPETMAERLHDSPAASLHRSAAYLVGGFAGLAILLSSIGLYGVIAYSVSQRTREIGVRMALGAERSAVYRLILGEAARLAVAGIGAGLLCSLAASRLIGKLLFDVHPWDGSIFLAVTWF